MDILVGPESIIRPGPPRINDLVVVFCVRGAIAGFEHGSFAKAGNGFGPSARQKVDQVKVMARLVEKQRAAKVRSTAPVAHDVGAVLGMEQFIGLDGHNLLVLCCRCEVFDQRRKAQDKPEHQPALKVARHVASGKIKGLLPVKNGRLFAKDLRVEPARGIKVFKVKMIG